MAIKKGVEAVIELGVTEHFTETNAEWIVNVLEEEPPHWFLTNPIRDLFAALPFFCREGNRCAHWLAGHTKKS